MARTAARRRTVVNRTRAIAIAARPQAIAARPRAIATRPRAIAAREEKEVRVQNFGQKCKPRFTVGVSN